VGPEPVLNSDFPDSGQAGDLFSMEDNHETKQAQDSISGFGIGADRLAGPANSCGHHHRDHDK
jgi:hypothetical protein